MIHCLRNNDSEIVEGNTYYGKVSELLPYGTMEMHKMFKLHTKVWVYEAKMYSESLYVVVNGLKYKYNTPELTRPYNIHVGIVRDGIKKFLLLNIEKTHPNPFISYSELTDEDLYMFIEIRRTDENVQKIKMRKKKIETDYRDLLLSGRKSDITIEVRKEKFYCHRCILGARSPVIAAMMERNLTNKANDVVTLDDAEPKAFKNFLLYLYSGNDDVLCWENITDVYKLADKYEIEDIKNICMDDIKDYIRPENFCEFFKFIHQLHNDSELSQFLIDFFLKHTLDIVEERTFIKSKWPRFLAENPVESNILITVLVDKYQSLVLKC